ncbi:hypothetical protein JKP88DRAFT_299668 [Tribonema minus]|uniref:Uncharacterized protein n=1 Tax=Tribonema minus TaxID=303371 RepID=A0A835ZAR2_9STRA|nr:hypothetical protein JKP88DRAFT_299668 [Tribonema minus]
MPACPILPGQISGGSSISRSLSSYATSKQRHSPALQGKNAPSSWRDHSISTSSSQKQRKEEMTRALADRLEQLQGMVDKLGSVFSSELQIQEIRNTAATRIASVVRMSLVRARYLHMRMVLRHWRVRHSALTMMCIQEELLRQKELQMGTYTKSAGLRYNMRRVERFARVHCLGPVFMAWSGYSKRHFRATRLQRKHLTLHLKGHFTAWVAAAKRLRSIRAMAIKHWIEESSQNARAYFGAWQRFVQREKQRAADHERLVALCRRSLTRRTTWRIMRAWHHLSVYGRVDGLYSRPQLITALAEEKQHALALGEKAQQLSHSLQEMENLAMDYRRQALARTREVRQCEATAAQTTMALHHAEQDVMRIQSLLDAATTISPPVLNALRNMAPDFNFQERGLTAWARLRAQNSAKAEEDRFQARLAALQLPSTKQLSADGGASSTTAGGAMHSLANPGQSKNAIRQFTSPRDIACSPGIDAATQVC